MENGKYQALKMILVALALFPAFPFILGTYFSIDSTDFNGRQNSMGDRLTGVAILALLIFQVVGGIKYLLGKRENWLFWMVMLLAGLEVAFYAVAFTAG